MQGSSNLTVSIGADSSKLRADLELAQKSLQGLRKELKAAADEAQRTGDRTGLDKLSKDVENAEADVRRYNRTLRESRKAHDEAGDGAAGHSKRLAELSNHADRVGSALRQFAQIATAAVAAVSAGFVKLATDAAKTTDELQDAAEALGITSQRMQALQLVAAQAGAEADTVTSGYARFVKILGQAQAGTKAAVEVFEKLGLNANNFAKTTAGNEQAYQAAAAALENLSEGGERAAVAAEIFGKGWAAQIEIVKGLGPNLAAAEKSLREWGLATDEVEKQQSAAYLKSYNTFLFVFNRIKTIVGNIFGTALIPLYDRLTEKLGQNGNALKAWANDVASKIKPVMEDLATLLTQGLGANFQTGAIQTLAGVLQGFVVAANAARVAVSALSLALTPLAALLNLIFGTNFTGTSLLISFAAALIVIPPIVTSLVAGLRLLWATAMLGPAAFAWVMGGGLATAFGTLTTAVTVFGTALRTVMTFLMATPWGVLLLALATAAVLIYENWDKIWPLFQSIWGKMQEWGAWLKSEWLKFWEDPAAAIKKLIDDLGEYLAKKLDEMWQAIVKWAANVVAKIKEALGAGGGGSTAAPAQSRAAGGYVAGPGSSTSDSILARLSNGEFVMKAAAVRHWGPQFMAALNALRNPFGSFADGGMVGARAIPSLAGAANGAAVHLHLDGQQFAMRADQDVAESLMRAARAKQMLSAGRKPGWAGGRRYGG